MIHKINSKVFAFDNYNCNCDGCKDAWFKGWQNKRKLIKFMKGMDWHNEGKKWYCYKCWIKKINNYKLAYEQLKVCIKNRMHELADVKSEIRFDEHLVIQSIIKKLEKQILKNKNE